MQKLDGNLAVKLWIVGLIDDAHCALADNIEHDIASQRWCRNRRFRVPLLLGECSRQSGDKHSALVAGVQVLVDWLELLCR